MIGPVFARELAVTPRQLRFYAARALYAGVLVAVIVTAWLVLTGTVPLQSPGDSARFGATVFQILAPLQLALFLFVSAILAAGNISQEKDKQTLTLLLMTEMTQSELVLGKLGASLLVVLAMLASGLPVFASLLLVGGVSLSQILGIHLVTLGTIVVGGSLGTLIAFWRDRTFQTLALVCLVIVVYVAIWQVIGAGFLGESFFGISSSRLASAFEPFRAVLAAARPLYSPIEGFILPTPVWSFLAYAVVLAVVINAIAIVRLRVWNPTREARSGRIAIEGEASGTAPITIWGAEHDLERDHSGPALDARAAAANRVAPSSASPTEVRPPREAHGRVRAQRERPVWSNPILWREICTWAYGKKILFVKAVYLALAIAAGIGVIMTIGMESPAGELSPAQQILTPLLLLSLVIVNALAVTSLTTERDGRALNLLLVTEITPREFMLGKLLGVIYVGREAILAPLILMGLVLGLGGMTVENAVILAISYLCLVGFAIVLGLHCGMIYMNSRQAIGVSLGTIFFLFLGVATCMVILITLSRSFSGQLPPFLLIILGGGVGLYLALGARHPSAAVGIACMALPFATFYAITSFLVRHHVSAFVVVTAVYAFTTAALLIPAISEFRFATDRPRSPAD